MLQPYRRHRATCPDKNKGQSWTRCACPIWVYGVAAGETKPTRQALNMRDWGRALRHIERLESKGLPVSAVPDIAAAVAKYLADCESRKLEPATVRSYRALLGAFVAHCSQRRIFGLDSLDTGLVSDFRGTRDKKPLTQRKELGILRGLFRFCELRKWIDSNPASGVKAPEDQDVATLPYEDAEVSALIAACDRICNRNRRMQEWSRIRGRALVLLLLYSGFRISDAINLQRSRIDDTGRLKVRTMKTKVWLTIQLPPVCMDALNALPADSPYFFRASESKLSTAISGARAAIYTIGRTAGVKARPHRFRDTFAVALLLKGEDIRTVQLLLGHKSIKTTENHYAHFVPAFQARLDNATAKLTFGG